MTTEREIKHDEEVYKKADRYYCAECHSEVPIKQDCPTCKKKIDWDRVRYESRVF